MAEPWHVQLVLAWMGVLQDPYWTVAASQPVVHTVYVLRDSTPNLAEWITAVGTAVTGLGVVSVFFGARTANSTLTATQQQVLETRRALSEAEKTRKTAVFMQTQDRWDESDLIQIRKSLNGVSADQFRWRFDRSFATNTDEWYNLVKLGNYFENLAILESVNGADFDLINTSIGNSVMHYWDLYGPTIMDDRDRWASFYANWEGLANKIKLHRAEHGNPDLPDQAR